MEQKMAFLKQAGPWLMVLLVLLVFIAGTVALGRPGTPPVAADPRAVEQAFAPVQNVICQAAGFLRGPLGVGLVLVMFAVGAISLMVGGRKALPVMLTAAIGGVLLAALPSIAGLFINLGQVCPAVR